MWGVPMNVYKPSKIRNVVLLGHAGSGKTSLAETMLFESGAISRMGRVEDKNTVSDYHQLEKEKQKSVFASFLNLDWRGYKINVIDTPGTSDYIGEVISSIRIADLAIFVLDAEHGIEAGTEALWAYTREREIPSIFVVNKLDADKADFQKVVDGAKERFGRGVVPLQYPYSEGPDFHAIVDVLKMTMYEFPESGGKPDKLPIPESQKNQADLLHNEMIEAIAENDESLMDIYFEKGTLDEEEVSDGMRAAMINGDIFPLFCVSSRRNMGTGRVMGFIDSHGPLAAELKPDKTTEGEVYEFDPDGNPVAFMFKAVSEDHVGDLMYFKVYSGSIKTGMDLVNASNGNSNRIGSIFLSQGNKRVEVNEVKTGDIAAVVKLKDTAVNDTLCLKGHELMLEPTILPDPTIRVAVRSQKTGEEEKLGTALNQIHREDPSIIIEHSAELKQIIVNGQGEEHLNMVMNKLKNKYKVDAVFEQPKIPYRETITKAVRSHYKHKKQSGGAGQYGEVHMLIEPLTEHMPEHSDLSVRGEDIIDLSWGGQLVFRNCIVGGVIDTRFLPAILKGIMDKMENGPLSGCRARDVRVSVFDGSMHQVDSNEAAFKTAGMMAFKNGFLEAAPQLLEPVYEVEITVPGEYMGDIMGDLSTRRGQILGMDSEGVLQTVKAKVPLAELYKYATHLKSMTQGRGTHKRRFDSYMAVPRDIQERIMQENLELEEA